MAHRSKARLESGGLVEYEDGRTYDSEVVRSITQEWVEAHMTARDKEFTKHTECNVFCGTWNVNAKKQDGSLQDWILPSDNVLADVYAVGFQEIVDLNAMNVAINSGETQKKTQFWHDKIGECLESTGVKFTLIMEKALVGLLICVYVKDELLPHVKDVRSTSTGVGLMGMMGNKGGVAVRLSVYDSSLCFVCAHLAAHRENIAGRNADFKNIVERSVFSSDPSATGEAPQPRAGDDVLAAITMPKRATLQNMLIDLQILDHEIVYWIGDLNYRIDDVFTTDEVFNMIEDNELHLLRDKDQLNIERAKGNVFQGFDEGVLEFAPTYKYQPGTDMYDRRPEKKIRAPAWCDRVLWRSENPKAVRQVNYRCAQLHPSDHKPVSSLLTCELRTIVENAQRVVFQELMEVLRKHTSNSSPVVEIKGLIINLEKVQYEQPQVSKLDVVNTGKSIVHWHFVPKLEERRVCKQWITLSADSGLLLPGETAVVDVTINVDKRAAQILNAGKDSLEDLIILRVEKSIDFHVAVSATYERSCYGMSLQELVHTLQPVASTPLPVQRFAVLAAQMADGDVGMLESPFPAGTEGKQLSVPKELWRLVDALWSSNALKEKDLFNSKADPAEVAMVRYSLDHGRDFPVGLSPHSICEALVSFLQALPQPLLPPESYPSSDVEALNMRAFCRKFLEELPPLNYNVFVYVLSFMREVLSELNYNRCTPLLLANVCVNCMMYATDEEHLSKDEKQKRINKTVYMQSIIIDLLTTPSL
eukprot:gene14590-16746_t